MIDFKKILVLIIYTVSVNAHAKAAKNCPDESGQYGEGIPYQNIFCKIVVADRKDLSIYRSITFNDAGLVQVSSNYLGATGARVYYLFPLRQGQEITSLDSSHLSVLHPSGVQFDFDKKGKISSSDLKIKVSNNVSLNNKSGVEMESYKEGLLIDLGYKNGSSPKDDKNTIVTITDKNSKKCGFPNSKFHKIDKYSAELIYPTNESLYKFLSKQCPGLDISDLIKLRPNNMQTVKKASGLDSVPAVLAPRNKEIKSFQK